MMQNPKSLLFLFRRREKNIVRMLFSFKTTYFRVLHHYFVRNYLEFIIFRERNNNHNKINAHKVAKIDIKAMKLSSEKRFEKSK